MTQPDNASQGSTVASGERPAQAALDIPELDKQKKAIDEGGSQQIGEFLEWLAETRKILLCVYDNEYMCFGCRNGKVCSHRQTDWLIDVCDACKETDAPLEDCDTCDGKGWYTGDDRLVQAHVTVENLLAEYFEIDLTKAETEKRMILQTFRDANATDG